MDIRTIILHLSLIDGIGPATIDRLISSLSYKEMVDIYRYTAHDIAIKCGVSMKIAQAVVAGLRNSDILRKELALIEKNTIQWAVVYDSGYPQILKTIHLPPAVIYWRGVLPYEYDKALAIVGSRKANGYAKKVIENFMPPLVEQGYIIVSGGALGADTMAHRAALSHQGITIAVLGSGLLSLYPRENISLFEEIIERGGCVLSSFGLTQAPMPANFPARNRIIAGLSQGCLVVQASEKSGAKITAQFCLDNGKEIFAVPGSIDDPLSVGCHDLIRDGAILVRSVDDILETVGHQQNKEEVVMSCVQKEPEIASVACPKRALIVAVCRKSAQSIDDLLEYTALSLIELNGLLFTMQLEEIVCQNAIGLWQLC